MVNYALPAGVTKAEADAAPGYSWSKADQRTNDEFEGPQPCIRCCYSLAKGRDCSGHSLTGCTQCVRGKHGACVPLPRSFAARYNRVLILQEAHEASEGNGNVEATKADGLLLARAQRRFTKDLQTSRQHAKKTGVPLGGIQKKPQNVEDHIALLIQEQRRSADALEAIQKSMAEIAEAARVHALAIKAQQGNQGGSSPSSSLSSVPPEFDD